MRERKMTELSRGRESSFAFQPGMRTKFVHRCHRQPSTEKTVQLTVFATFSLLYTFCFSTSSLAKRSFAYLWQQLPEALPQPGLNGPRYPTTVLEAVDVA